AAGGELGDRVRSVDGLDDLVPLHLSPGYRRKQLVDRCGRCDVFTGPLGFPEPPTPGLPPDQITHGVANGLGHERLDHLAVHVPEVDEQLTEAPALQLLALRLER